MKVIVNDAVLTLNNASTLLDMLTRLSQNHPGTALAVNQAIVPRDCWSTHILQEGDDVVIFHAIAGG